MSKVSLKTMSSHVSWEWPTPRKFYEELDREFHFNFDPCPLGGNGADGASPLFTEWAGKRVFCNPPYGPQIPRFLARAEEAQIAVFLVPARTDTRWFHDICLPRAKEIRFIRGRLYNRVEEGLPNNNAWPFPTMLVIFERQGS